MKPRPRIRKTTRWVISQSFTAAVLYIIYRYMGPEWICVLFGAWGVLGLSAMIAIEWWYRRQEKFRSSHGLCLECGYDRAGIAHGAACPECGTIPSSV